MPLSAQARRRKEIRLYINNERQERIQQRIGKTLHLPDGGSITPKDAKDVIYAALDSVLNMHEPD